MTNQNEHSEALFESLQETKQKKKQKRKRTIVTILAVVAVVLIAGVLILRAAVTARFGGSDAEVLSYEAARTTISTTVSGSGALAGVDMESIVLPAGVEVTEVTVRNGASVAKGDVLATVNMTTVLSTLAALQEELDAIDEEIGAAEGDKVGTTVRAGVSGRVKAIYAEKGEEIAACMVDHGALAIISLDGYMAVEIESEALKAGDTVSVTLANGNAVSGTVETAVNGKAVVLVTDNGPAMDETVTVADSEGNALGSGQLYVHNPLSVTAVAGAVSTINVSENAWVSAATTVFTLKNTDYSANYDTLLRERTELEEVLLQLLRIYRDGAVLAQYDGMVSSVDFTEYVEDTDTALVSLYPNERMSVTISVDEADIMSLELGQQAEVTVSSVSDSAFSGTVTEISKAADTSSGVTRYSATVELDYSEGMLVGMSAKVVVKIEGVENAIVVPVEAVHQTSAISFVYTSYNEKTGQYGDMVEVTTGLSNDNYVEIIRGLEEGDTVYYTEAADDFFSMMGGFSGMSGMPNMGGNGMSDFGGGGMPNMGGSGRPDFSGGGMPSGGMPSGMGRGG